MKAGAHFTAFCKAYLRHTKGQWAGDPVVLERWQQQLAHSMLQVDAKTRKRRFREALIGIPRKNGKSTLCSALALYFLVVEGIRDPGAEVYSAAATREQARIVFGQAREMVLASPALMDFCQVHRDAISVPSTGAVYRVLSGDRAAGAAHGLNVSAAIVDELHAHTNPELYYALRTAMRARDQPLLVSITTAGFDLDTICGELYTKGKGGEDPRFYFQWFEAPERRLRDRKAWLAANPASWITIEGLEEDAASLPPAVFERLHLNRWTETVAAWLPPGAWDACERDDVRPEAGERIWVGVDLGLRHDTAAVAWVAMRDGVAVADSYVWAVPRPGSKTQPPAHEIVAGDEFEVALAREFVRELGRDFDVQEVAFDPYRFKDSAQMLESEGFLMVEFPQNDVRMVPASSSLYERIKEGRLEHDGDPVFAKHIANAAARETGSGQRLSKKDGKKAMDGAVALALALERAEAAEWAADPAFEVLL